MPDSLNFDHLDQRRRCIDCGAVFHPWEKRAMKAHYREHEKARAQERKRAAAAKRREATSRLRQVNRLRRELKGAT